MAVAVDSVSTLEDDVSPASWTHPGPASGANLYVLVALHTEDVVGSPAATYGGVAMSLIRTQSSGGDTKPITTIFGLFNPPPGNQTVIVTWTGTAVRGIHSAILCTGVDPDDDPAARDNGLGGQAGSSASINVSSEAGGLVLGFLGVEGENVTVSTVAPGAGQTQRYEIDVGGISASDLLAAGSDEPGATSVTISWDFSATPDKWNIIGVPLKAERPRPLLLKYHENVYISRLHGQPHILDTQGRAIPVEQLQFDQWIRQDGPFLPTSFRFANLVQDPAVAYIEGLRIQGERATITTAKESMLDSLLRRLGRSA
jgi:hypothetical protein